MSDETEVPLIFRGAAIIPLARSTYRNWSSWIVMMLSLSFSFSFTPPTLSFKPPQRALVAVAYRENAWKDSRERLWKGEGRMQLAWGRQNLKRALRWGNGGGKEGRRVRSVVAIVETIPNGWMRHGKRERKFLVCPRRHRPFDLIKNHLLSKLIRKATVNHLRGHSKRFLSVHLQRNPFVFLSVIALSHA